MRSSEDTLPRASGREESVSKRVRRCKACHVNIAEKKIGLTPFNKNHIQIAMDAVESVPTLQESGLANISSLRLYDVAKVNGDVVAFVEKMRAQIADYVPRDLAERHRGARTLQEFRTLARRAMHESATRQTGRQCL